ncbi:GH32 C-terminal domain-containing protein, partial [Paenibacillus xylanivorans]
FQLRQREGQKTTVGYRVDKQNMFVDRTTSGEVSFSDLFTKFHEAPLQPENQKVKLRIFVDESSIEVFGNDGKVVFSDVIFPDPAGRAMAFYSLGGEVKVSSMKVYTLDNIWRKSASSKTQIIADVQRRTTNIGQTQTLYATVESTPGKGAAQPLKWKVNNPKVVQIVHAEKTKATVRAVGGGDAVVTVSTADGKASVKIPITVSSGTFHTNLSGWKSDKSSAEWLLTKQGIQGNYSGDTQYIAQETAGDFQYDADLTLGAQGGAGSIVFRASEDGRSGYYLNIDPNLKSIRLFYKVNGKFENRQVLAQIPRFIRKDQTYHIKIQADGPRIQIDMDGERIIDLQDGTFAEGHFGVHVFGGSASFQNVNAIHTKKADLEQGSIRNAGRPVVMHAVPSEGGEVIKVADESENVSEGFKWVLVPTGDNSGSYSIRTLSGKSLDWDVGQNRIQLYSYLGYANQRWSISKNEDGTMRITSAHNGHALGISEDGSELVMGEFHQESEYQKWVFKQQ